MLERVLGEAEQGGPRVSDSGGENRRARCGTMDDEAGPSVIGAEVGLNSGPAVAVTKGTSAAGVWASVERRGGTRPRRGKWADSCSVAQDRCFFSFFIISIFFYILSYFRLNSNFV
jgi:hypothetical protein